MSTKHLFVLAPLFALALPLLGCDAETAAAEDGPTSGSLDISKTGPNRFDGGTGSSQFGGSCQSDDPEKRCLAIHFVAYKDSSGTPVASPAQAATIIGKMNAVFGQCNIGFQIETYEAVSPADYGLAYGADSQNQTEEIRQTFSDPTDQLLAVTTGPWGTAVNAWTNMPGEGNYGAIMEKSIVGYGNGIIYAHEFGHYLGLDHLSDSSNLMNAVISTTSDKLSADQCEQARDTIQSFWSSMLRY